MTNYNNQQKCICVLTSGGDAPGMNAAVRAVVRTGLHHGLKVFVIKEGFEGLVKAGEEEEEYITEVDWDYVSGILHKGGTKIGSSRCEEFKGKGGAAQLKAARNLIKKGIDRLIVIGGDGSLTGANVFHEQWPELLKKLVASGEVTSEEADRYPRLAVVGLVASIDNDMCGVEMTIGANTALHRISEAVDDISSTAASHQRIFVVETMGRQCGYLALMSALITGADWVIIPEEPPGDEEWKKMLKQLKTAREKKQKRSIIVVLAEGLKDCHGVTSHDSKKELNDSEIKEISSKDVAEALKEGLKREGEVKPPDVRVTILGHVQRGGTPSAYDRILSSLLGYGAVKKILSDETFDEPQIVVGVKGSRDDDIKSLPLKETVEKNKSKSEVLGECNFEKKMKDRGKCFHNAYQIARILMKPEQLVETLPLTEDAPCFAVLHSGAPAPGMNAAARAAVRLGINNGYRMLGVKRGFKGLINGDIKPLGWSDVNGWASMGGAELEISRKIPGKGDFDSIESMIKKHNIKGLLIIGGWSGYKGAWEMYKEYNKFNIPIICMPTTINNNLPGTEVCIGSDTAINNIMDAVDKIKQSAVAVRRCFLVEVMGRYCGYLALMSGLVTGAEGVYMHEKKSTLDNLQDDLKRFIREFGENKRRLALIIRNERAHRSYNSEFINALFNEESEGKFDARYAILGHLQQGGEPSPFDRILATRLAYGCINFLVEKVEKKYPAYAFIGIREKEITLTPMGDFPRLVEEGFQRAIDPWWFKLKDIASMLAQAQG
jgi:6-phosphofructokinase 1